MCASLDRSAAQAGQDRQTDPQWTDYDAIIAGMTDLAYDRYGLRVQWTLFGGAPSTPSGPSREALVDRFAALARGREHKIFAFEIANEAWQNGFAGPEGLAELRRLGQRLNEKTPVLVALSSPSKGAACATYAGSGADAMTLHYERGFGTEGPTGPLRRPWSFPAAYDGKCRGQLPPIVLNNEPIGPESSVRQDDSPSRIAAGYVMTFLAGNAAYVLHSGPGIRGGGAADVSSKLQRHAHFDELPSFKPITAALAAAKQYLPPGLANWTRHAPNAETAPIRGVDSLFTASSEGRFIALAVGITAAGRRPGPRCRLDRNQGIGDGKDRQKPEGRLGRRHRAQRLRRARHHWAWYMMRVPEPSGWRFTIRNRAASSRSNTSSL